MMRKSISSRIRAAVFLVPARTSVHGASNFRPRSLLASMTFGGQFAAILAIASLLSSCASTPLVQKISATAEASRLFAGPHQYPPKDFAAYGILAFRSRATPHDRKRYLMICEAYVAALPHVSEVPLPRSRQMATVWPITSDNIATELNKAPLKDGCGAAVDNYGLVTATEALKDARRTGAKLNRRGPYLLAWSPSTQKGKSNALVLVADLSDVTTPEEAKLRLLRWKTDILLNPKIWPPEGWNLQQLRVTIREWADRYGPKILVLFGGHA